MSLAMKQAPTKVDASSRSRKDLRDLQRLALYHYDKSISTKTPNEQTVAHRGHAKEYAYELRNRPEHRTNALNLLARIALDEGFYDLAQHFIEDALSSDPKDAGCWYSLGHVHLARKSFNDALIAFSKALDISPKHTRAATSLAYTLAKQGRVVDAFNAYRNLYRLHPSDNHVKEKLFEVVAHIKADFYQEDLARDVIEWLSIRDVDHQALANIAVSLLHHKYQLDNPNAIVDLQDIARDKLFSKVLGKIYLTDANFELFIVTLRKQVLLNCIASEYQDQRLLRLAHQLALNSEFNEHVYAYDNDERDLVNSLQDLIESADMKSLMASGHWLVLYGMYEPVHRLTLAPSISKIQLSRWPSYLRAFIEQALINIESERQIATTIPRLGAIADAVSVEVKQQYEENPYPRWLHLGYNTPTNYGRALERELAGFRAPDFFNMGTIKVLVAGAGTGRHALRVARYFRNVEVLAIDLSARSLAYAKRMAEQSNINNITFLCADILELDNLDEQFHVIECSGVLHHMKDPAAGLKALNKKLRKNGLIKIGLYSYEAREIVRTIRHMIQQYDLPISATGIRTMRQAILEGNMPYDFSGITTSQDFYSLSGCRDLLFHVQEHQFVTHEIESLLHDERLNFLGFVTSEHTRNDYRAMFSDDSNLTNLTNWGAYEQKYPKTFAGMYQFYAQKK